MPRAPKENIVVEIPAATLATSTTSVSVTASGPWGDEEREIIYPTAIPSGEIVIDLSRELGTIFKPKDKKQLTKIVDHTKTFVSELEIDFYGIKLKLKREPKKTIKIFQEIK